MTNEKVVFLASWAGSQEDAFFNQLLEIAARNIKSVQGLKNYVQRQPHLSIEPDVGFAYTDAEGVVTIHSKSIALYIHHFMICKGLGLEPDKLRLIMNPQGGNFGYKLSPTLEAFCAIARRKN